MTSSGNHWSSLTPGAGGRWGLNRRARPQALGRASTSYYGKGKEMGAVDGTVHADFLCFEGPWAGELGNWGSSSGFTPFWLCGPGQQIF